MRMGGVDQLASGQSGSVGHPRGDCQSDMSGNREDSRDVTRRKTKAKRLSSACSEVVATEALKIRRHASAQKGKLYQVM